MIRDLRHACRILFQTKAWTAVVLLSLALGIGANTALFTAVNGLLLQTVPVPDADALVRLKWYGQNDMMRNSSDYGFSRPHEGKNVRSTFSYAVFQELRKANTTLTDLFAAAPSGTVNVVADGTADLASVLTVSGNYFSGLRVGTLAGRVLLESDDVAGAPPVAVITEAFWKRRFGGDPATLGRVVTMNGTPVTIVGVQSTQFTIQQLGATARDVTIPLAVSSQVNPGSSELNEPTSWWLQIMGRQKPGGTHEQVVGNFEGVLHATARAGLDAYLTGLTPDQRALSTNQPRGSAVPRLLVSSGRRGVYDLDNNSARSAGVLAAVVITVLLIVCANVANLLLSRATSRRKEISVRLSMGATRSRLIRQLLTESLLISTIGGALGIVLGTGLANCCRSARRCRSTGGCSRSSRV